jgi:hypothetical protein
MRWIGRRVPLPGAVRAALHPLFGEDVDKVEVIEHSLIAKLHFLAIATTRRRRIYLRGSAAAFFDDPSTVLHEFCHVLRQWEPGLLTTRRYVAEWFRRGYWDNRFEIEAREFAEDNLYRFRALLSRHGAAGARSGNDSKEHPWNT